MSAIETSTPAEIDAQIADLSSRQQIAAARYEQYQRFADAAQPGTWAYNDYSSSAQRYYEESESLKAQLAPLYAEFKARGGWERAFLVTNGNGHIHRSMSCATCFQTTTFTWLTELSGKTEAEIIEYAGHRACTVCYPQAPVAKLTTAERKAISEAQADAKRAAKAEVKLQKELAKIPRQQTLALKVNELFDAFGEDTSAAYRATWEGGQFAKGYDTAFHLYDDIIERRRVRRPR